MQFCKRICIYLILLLFPTIVNAKILFLAAPTRAEHYAIYVMDDDGSNRTLVYNAKPNIYHVRWSPTGQIVFETGRAFYMINPDGTNLRQLADIKAGIHFFAFSPDGKQIVFVKAERINNKSVRSIQILNIQTQQTRKIKDFDLATDDGVAELDWSPDGKNILFSTPILLGGEKLGNSIYMMDTSGRKLKELLVPPGIGELNISRWHPRWAPDGNRFVYRQSEHTWEERKPGALSHIPKAFRCIICDKAGKTLRKLNVSKNLAASYFAWTDDGKSIIFEGAAYELNAPPPGFGNESPDHIYKYDLLENKLKQLTVNTNEQIVSVDWISDDVLPVSPKGKKKVTWGTLKQ